MFTQKSFILFVLAILAILPLASFAFPRNNDLNTSPAHRLMKRANGATGPLTPVERDNLSDKSKAEKNGGLEIWSGMGKGIRASIRTNKAIKFQNGAIDMQSVQDYAQPAAIAVGLGFALAIIYLIAFILMICRICCAVCCRKCVAVKITPSKVSKTIVYSLLALCSFAYVVICIGGYRGSEQISTALDNLHGSVLITIDDVSLLLGTTFPAAIGQLVDVAVDGIDTMFGVLENVLGLNEFVAVVSTNAALLSGGLRQADTAIGYFSGNGSYVATNVELVNLERGYVSGNLTDCKNDFDALRGTLSNAATSNPYALDDNSVIPPFPDIASLLPQDFSGTPDVNAYINDFTGNIPDLNAQADTIDSSVATLGTSIVGNFNNVTGQIKDSAKTTVRGLEANILDNMGAITGISTQLTGFRTDFSKTYTNVVKANLSYKDYVFYAIFTLIIMWVTTVWGSGMSKKAKPIRCCGHLFTIFMVLVMILSSIFFVITIIFGEVCTFLEEPARLAVWQPTLDSLSPGTDIAGILGKVNTVRTSCRGGRGVLYAAMDAGLLDSSMFNLTSIITQTVDGVDVSGIGSNFDATNSFDFGGDVANSVSSFTNGDVTSFNFTSIIEQCDAEFIDTSALDDFMDAIKLVCDNIVAASVTTDDAGDAADFKTKCGAAITKLNNTRNYAVTAVPSRIQNIRNGVINLNAAAVSTNDIIIGMLGTFNSTIGNITAYSSTIVTRLGTTGKDNVRTAAIGIVNDDLIPVLQSGLSCDDVAKDTLALQNSFCAVLIGGFDAVWFSLYLTGFISIIGIPTMFIFSRFFLNKPGAIFHQSSTKGKDDVYNFDDMDGNDGGRIKASQMMDDEDLGNEAASQYQFQNGGGGGGMQQFNNMGMVNNGYNGGAYVYNKDVPISQSGGDISVKIDPHPEPQSQSHLALRTSKDDGLSVAAISADLLPAKNASAPGSAKSSQPNIANAVIVAEQEPALVMFEQFHTPTQAQAINLAASRHEMISQPPSTHVSHANISEIPPPPPPQEMALSVTGTFGVSGLAALDDSQIPRSTSSSNHGLHQSKSATMSRAALADPTVSRLGMITAQSSMIDVDNTNTESGINAQSLTVSQFGFAAEQPQNENKENTQSKSAAVSQFGIDMLYGKSAATSQVLPKSKSAGVSQFGIDMLYGKSTSNSVSGIADSSSVNNSRKDIAAESGYHSGKGTGLRSVFGLTVSAGNVNVNVENVDSPDSPLKSAADVPLITKSRISLSSDDSSDSSIRGSEDPSIVNNTAFSFAYENSAQQPPVSQVYEEKTENWVVNSATDNYEGDSYDTNFTFQDNVDSTASSPPPAPPPPPPMIF